MTTVLLGGLGTTTRVWEGQLGVLEDAVALDLPGHGTAPDPQGSVSVESIARDVLDTVPGRFAFVGVSLGGFVGMWLGANAPERLERLLLACTGAKVGSRDEYYERAAQVREQGTDQLVAGARERWFTPPFRDDPRAQAILEDLRGVSRAGYAACAEAVGDWDFRDQVQRIAVTTLVVYGRDDPVTPTAVRDQVAHHLPSVEIAGGHLANVESADAFNQYLRSSG
jgi:3-oxoadipate enol-lactonase